MNTCPARFMIGGALLITLGCDSQPQALPNIDSPRLEIVYQGNPVADIQVRLHGGDETAVLSQGISDQNGHVHFHDLPVPEPSEYFVTMESLGDGGWILDPKSIRQATQAMRLKSFAILPHQQFELPRNSIRPLTQTNER